MKSRGFYRPPKPAPKPEPQVDHKLEQLVDEIAQAVGPERFLRVSIKDQISYLMKRYDDWNMVAALMLDVALSEKEECKLSSFHSSKLDRRKEAMDFPRAAWRYVYKAHQAQLAGDDEKSAQIRHWILLWKSAAEYDESLIPEARKRLEKLCA